MPSANVRARGVTRVLMVAALAGGSGCMSDPLRPEERATASCDLARPLPDSISGTLRGGFYRMQGEVLVGRATFAPGVTVCADAGALLLVRTQLTATGTEDDPVILRASRPEAPWRGVRGAIERSTAQAIVHSGAVTMRHALVADADTGILSDRLDLEAVEVRRTLGTGVLGAGTMKDVVIDSACLGESRRCVALTVTWPGRIGSRELSLRGVRVRDSGGDGISVPSNTNLRTDDVAILRPRGYGLSVSSEMDPTYSDGSLFLDGPLSIVDPGGYRVVGSHAIIRRVAEATGGLAPGDSVLSINGSSDTLHIADGVSWSSRGSHYHPIVSFPGIRLGAGSRFHAASEWGHSGVLTASGTPEAPARFTGERWRTDSLVAEHAEIGLEENFTALGPGHRLRDILIDAPSVAIGGRGTRGEGITLSGRLDLEGGDIVLEGIHFVGERAGHGITIRANDVTLRRCSVSGNAGDGIHVAGGTGIVIRSCNLSDNGGSGVANEAADTVDAQENWWGDPAGADGPAGDGVSGAVDARNPLRDPVEPSSPSRFRPRPVPDSSSSSSVVV